MELPIPDFFSVHKCYYFYNEKTDIAIVRFIAPDKSSGAEDRFSVIEMNLKNGKAICIGRELPWKLSKKIAKLGLKKYFKKLRKTK